MIRLRRRRRLAFGGPEGPALPVEMFFRALAVEQARMLRRCYVGVVATDVVGKCLAEDEYMILATTVAPGEALGDRDALRGAQISEIQLGDDPPESPGADRQTDWTFELGVCMEPSDRSVAGKERRRIAGEKP